jgi:hypothetical protein
VRGESVVFDDFRGGANLDSAPYSLDLNQARDSLNGVSTNIGSFQKRNGFRNISDDGSDPTKEIVSLFPYNAATDFLIGVGDDGAAQDIYSITEGGVFTDIQGAATMSVGTKWDAIQAPQTIDTVRGPLFMLNGVDTPLSWDGSGNVDTWTAPTSGSVPNGKYIAYHNNRVWVAGVAANPSKLYGSGLGNPGDWASPSGVTTDFDPDDGEPITGLGTIGPYLLVFKPSKTYVVFNTDTAGYRRISDGVGCVANKSIVETDQGTFFLSTDQGIMTTDGSSVSPISTKVDSLLSDANSEHAAATYHKKKYYLSFDIGGHNDHILELDTRYGSFFPHRIQVAADEITGVNDWAILNPSTDMDLYAAAASDTTPCVFEAFAPNTFADNGLGYESYWITQWHTMDMPHIRKILRQLRVDALGQFQFAMAKSFAPNLSEEGGQIWEQAEGSGSTIFGGSGTFGGSGGTFGGELLPQEHRFYTLGTARAFSFKFFSELTSSWELYAYTMALGMRRD